MTIAYVKNADGTGGTVQNTFRDTAGTLHTLLSDYYTDDAGAQHQVFFTILPTTPPEGIGQTFLATTNRNFVASTDRDFIA